MVELNWFQKLFTREVVGIISEREYAEKSIGGQPVTLYSITDEDGKVFRGAQLGYKHVLDLGDRVAMYLNKGTSLGRREEERERTMPDGTVKVVPKEVVWEEIIGYGFLDDIVRSK